MKRGTRALLAAFLLALPISGFAADKYAVKLSDSYWQLIGVGGLFQLAGEGSAAQNPDFSSPNGCSAIAVVDIADSANHISWDGDFSTQGGNQNTIASTSGDGYNFGAGTVPAAANLLNTDETNTSGIGLPYHSVLGVRAIAGANGARKAVVVIGTGIGSNTNGSCKLVGKDYTSPMRTMYVVSPYASAPDVLITYQAIYEGEPFKISFKNSLTALWGTPSSDRIYIGTLDRAKTYANPARINSELTLLVSTAGSQAADAGALNQVICTGANAVAGSYNCAFTNDIGQYLATPFSIRADYETNRAALDGNLTLYRYAAINTPALWEIQTFTGDGTTESTTSASNLNLLTPGYGYWARHVRGDTSVDGGLLLQENIEGRAEFYNGKLAEGWNLLAFDDSRLRYTTSGVVIGAGATTPLYIISPFGDVNISLAGIAASDVDTFNTAVAAYNQSAANVNRFNVHAYVSGTNVVLISDKPFYIALTGSSPTGFTSLAGQAFSAAEVFDIDNVGTKAVNTKLGEYALAVEVNRDYNITGLPWQIGFGLPAWLSNGSYSNQGGVLSGVLSSTDVNASFASINGLPSGGSAQVLDIDLNNSNSAISSPGLLFASTERFFVREETGVRVFDLYPLYPGNDVNGTIVSVVVDGQTVDSGDVNYSDVNSVQPKMLDDLIDSLAAAVSADYIPYILNQEENNSLAIATNLSYNFDIKETSGSGFNLLLDRYAGTQADANNSVYGPFLRAYQASALASAAYQNSVTTLSATTPDLTYAAFWADDFPNNGPIYYMTANGYTPEMFISAETAGANTITSNPAGTISWKALDVTRNPAEWFNPANGFELFWAEKERGYWVYLSQGFNNPVTLADVQFSSTSRVYKHFNVPEVGGESDVYPVFNWFSGSLTARVGGLVRANYTSGQSYNVQADVNGETVVLTPTGPVYAAGSDFTAYVSDFAVSSLRPTSAIEAVVTASDGLGGRNSGSTVLQYVQPSTPTLSFNGNILTAASDPNAHNILLFNGHPSDANYNHIEAYAATEGNVSIDLSAVEGITYPVALAVPTDGTVEDENNVSFRDIVKELLIGASTGAPDTLAGSFSSGTSVYSNLRRQFYLPVYSNTAHLRVSASENNATKPIAFYQTGTLDQTKNDYGVQLAGNGSNLQNRIATVVFQPKAADLADGGLTHANLYTDGNEFVGELGYIQSVYQGEVFYVFVIEDTTGATGSWYYGVFQGNNGLQWGVNGNINGGGDPYKLVVRRVDTLQQL